MRYTRAIVKAQAALSKGTVADTDVARTFGWTGPRTVHADPSCECGARPAEWRSYGTRRWFACAACHAREGGEP